MAVTVYGTNYTKYRAEAVLGTAAGSKIGPNVWTNGHYYDEYTTDGSETTGSLIYLGILRQGETYVGGAMQFPVIVSAGTIIFGDGGYTDLDGNAITADTDRYLASTSVASAGPAHMLALAGMGFTKLGSSRSQSYANPITGGRPDLALYATTGGATYASAKRICVAYRVANPAD